MFKIKERWKDVIGYEGHYQVSNLGRVKSLKPHFIGKIKNLFISKKGYVRVSLFKGGRGTLNVHTVHTLVMKAFKGAKNLQVNHKNGNKKDNRLINLEYVSNLKNMNHRYTHLKKQEKYGAYFNKQTKKWQAQIKVENHRVYLGSYVDKKEAQDIFYVAYTLSYGVAPW